MTDLSESQRNTQQQIVDYGIAHGFSGEQIGIAVKAAFIESSLGSNLGPNPQSTASGLFGYTNGTWNLYHSGLGEKNNIGNQINAFYSDMQKYTNWYNSPSTNYNIPMDQISLDEYIYIKHHDGVGYSDFLNAEGLDTWNASGFDFNPGALGNGSGDVGKTHKIDESLCTACGACETACMRGAIEMGGDTYEIDPDECDGCIGFSAPQCADVCPVNACVPA